MTREQWLGSHPYLRPLAEFHSALDEAVAAWAPAAAAVPEFEDHRADYAAGVPLLQSSGVVLDLEPAAQLLTPLFARLAARPPPGRQAAELRALEAELRATPDAPRRALAWLLGQGDFPSSAPGMLQFAGWHALARFLQPLVQAFGAWRDDERWLRRYCPTCGAPPAMAQLVGNDPGRKRIF